MKKYPTLYTLQGNWDASSFPVPGIISGAYMQDDSYREQNFQVMSGDWGVLNFLRPSRAKTWLPAVGTAALTVGALFPPTSPIATPLLIGGAIAGGAGVAAGAIHESYRGGSGDPANPGTGYQPGAQPPPVVGEEKKMPWLPITIGIGGLIAALALS